MPTAEQPPVPARDTDAATGGEIPETMTAEEKKADWPARIVSVLSLIVAATTLYCSTLRAPDVRVSVGQHVLVNQKPRIGVLCSFTNEGAHQAVITSATLKWDYPSVTLPLQMTSTTLEQWEFDDQGNIKEVVPARYTPLVAPIAIKGRDQAGAFFWFTSIDRAFEYTSGKHSAILTIYSGAEKLAENQFEITLKDSDIENLKNQKNSPTAEYRIEVLSQK